MHSESSKAADTRELYTALLVTQMGGLGDVVLTSQLIASLREAFPNSAIHLACRAANASVAELFPVKPDNVIGIDCNPSTFATPGVTDNPAVGEAFAPYRADIVISAEYRPHSMSFAAARLTGAKKLLGTWAAPPDQPEYTIADGCAMEFAELPPDAHVLDRLNALSVAAGGAARGFPQWTLPERVQAAGLAFLRPDGLNWKEYTVAFPFGAPGTETKRWPAERFASVLNTLRANGPLDVVFVGTSAEREGLETLARTLTGDGKICLCTSADASVETVCAIIAGARSFLGNDTGPLHVAGAYGVPGVAIYGGGHWPVYKPWAPGAIGVVEELPCFGCEWDCVLGHGLCVESVPASLVIDAMQQVHAREGAAEPEVRKTHTSPAEIFPILRDASRRYREAQIDRAARYRSILSLQATADIHISAIQELQQIANERLEALEAASSAYKQLAADSEMRLAHIHELTRQVEIRDKRIADLEVENSARLIAIQVESEALAATRVDAEKRASDVNTLTEVIGTLRSEIQALQAEIAVIDKQNLYSYLVRRWAGPHNPAQGSSRKQ